jgi:hypothetical protein
MRFKILRSVLLVSAIAMLVSSCGTDRGGVIVDASGEQGGGTQPGGGGFAFVLLFVVVAGCAIAMFTMDRIKKNK